MFEKRKRARPKAKPRGARKRRVEGAAVSSAGAAVSVVPATALVISDDDDDDNDDNEVQSLDWLGYIDSRWLKLFCSLRIDPEQREPADQEHDPSAVAQSLLSDSDEERQDAEVQLQDIAILGTSH